MRRVKKPLVVTVTHHYVSDPEAVDRGMRLWAHWLAEALKRRIPAESSAEPADHQEKPA